MSKRLAIQFFGQLEKTFKLSRLVPSKHIKHKIKQYKVLRTQLAVADHLTAEYVSKYLDGKLQSWDITPKQDLGTDKIIWQYWDQGIDDNTPRVVRMCFDSVDQYMTDYKIIRLTRSSIDKYIDIPSFIYERIGKDQFGIAAFSDVLRLCLLNAYGGVWIDATIYLTDHIDANILNSDFFAYQRSVQKPIDYKKWEKHNIDYFNWHTDCQVRICNSFLVSKKHNKLLLSLLDILLNYWQLNKNCEHYFIFQIVFNIMIARAEYAKLNCEIGNDTDIHLLHLNANKSFNAELLNTIKQSASIQKLSYFKDIVPNSMIAHVLDN